MTLREIKEFVPVCIALFLAVLCIAAFVSPVAADDGAGTTEPTTEVTEAPPTVEETQAPTQQPTQVPSGEPTQAPPEQTTTGEITVPTLAPTVELPTLAPLNAEPTEEPTAEPTEEPTEEPTQALLSAAPTSEVTPAPTETAASGNGGFDAGAFAAAIASNPDPPLNAGNMVPKDSTPTGGGFWNITTSDTYYLEKDWSLDGLWGIWIQASNVLLNGNGKTLTGDGSGIGVIVSDPSGGELQNVGISDLALQKWSVGIQLVNVLNGLVDGVTIGAADKGIVVQDSRDVLVNNANIADAQGNNADKNDWTGVLVQNSQNTQIWNSEISGIHGEGQINGIAVTGLSTNTELINNKIHGLSGSGNAKITGIKVTDSDSTNLTCNTIYDIRGTGNAGLCDDKDNNGYCDENPQIPGLTCTPVSVCVKYDKWGHCTKSETQYECPDNTGANGVAVSGSSDTTLYRNNIYDIQGNSGIGISLTDVDHATVANNSVSRSSNTNLDLHDVSDSQFTSNYFLQKNTGSSDNALNAKLSGSNPNNYWNGNYWAIDGSNKYGYSENCQDTNNDGYCDRPSCVDNDHNGYCDTRPSGSYGASCTQVCVRYWSSGSCREYEYNCPSSYPYTIDQDGDTDLDNTEATPLKNKNKLDTDCPGGDCPTNPMEGQTMCIDGYVYTYTCTTKVPECDDCPACHWVKGGPCEGTLRCNEQSHMQERYTGTEWVETGVPCEGALRCNEQSHMQERYTGTVWVETGVQCDDICNDVCNDDGYVHHICLHPDGTTTDTPTDNACGTINEIKCVDGVEYKLTCNTARVAESIKKKPEEVSTEGCEWVPTGKTCGVIIEETTTPPTPQQPYNPALVIPPLTFPDIKPCCNASWMNVTAPRQVAPGQVFWVNATAWNTCTGCWYANNTYLTPINDDAKKFGPTVIPMKGECCGGMVHPFLFELAAPTNDNGEHVLKYQLVFNNETRCGGILEFPVLVVGNTNKATEKLTEKAYSKPTIMNRFTMVPTKVVNGGGQVTEFAASKLPSTDRFTNKVTEQQAPSFLGDVGPMPTISAMVTSFRAQVGFIPTPSFNFRDLIKPRN